MNVRRKMVAAMALVWGVGVVAFCGGAGKSISVDPKESVIVVPAVSTDGLSASLVRLREKALNSAAEELRKHFQLITGVDVPIVAAEDVPDGKYPFFIGVAPTGAKELVDQETRWTTTPKGTWLYGDYRGPSYAVYGFLEDQLGVHWISPGDDGVVFKKQSALTLRNGEFNWIPQLLSKSIRLGDARIRKSVHKPKNKYAEFYPSLEEHNAFAEDARRWQSRVRMYGHRPGGSHSFSKWWKKYGKDHPEYFALNKYGKREPVPLPKGKERSEAFIKICAANPEVIDVLIAEWLPRKQRTQYVSCGVDDGSSNFCECAACRALDEPKEGEAWDAHLTDRYVHLANAVAREARKHRPDSIVTIYAYLSTLYPPRREKLEPNMVVQLVPYVDPLDLDVVEKHFGGWRKAGATRLMLRPNYHHKYLGTCMPIGVEKQMFDVFQRAYANGCVATDYDSMLHQWPVTGITDYILAKSMAEPDKPFDHWAEQYYSAFGDAAPEVREYFEYWRNEVWNKRLCPNIVKICELGGAGDFKRGLFWSLDKYYDPSDFDKTDGILDRAAKRKLTPLEAKRLKQLRLANEHARLTYEAVVAEPYDKPELAETLMAFRKEHKDELPLIWPAVFAFEKGNGDLTGMEIKDEMKDYLKPWYQTDLFWKFQLDPKDVGLKEKWQEKTWDELSNWHNFRTDRTWENQFAFDETPNLPDDVAKTITDYDGIGWYATRVKIPAELKGRNIFLRFGAVDESCWVYVNGKLAGEHIYKNTNDWKTPFEIQLNDFIDWDREWQMVVVRVEDKGGLGGVWRPVWLVSKASNK